jgi:hypothetical protein
MLAEAARREPAMMALRQTIEQNEVASLFFLTDCMSTRLLKR